MDAAGVVAMKSEMRFDICVCAAERGKEEHPSASPPRAWHAWQRREKLASRRLDKIEGMILANAGTNVEG